RSLVNIQRCLKKSSRIYLREKSLQQSRGWMRLDCLLWKLTAQHFTTERPSVKRLLRPFKSPNTTNAIDSGRKISFARRLMSSIVTESIPSTISSGEINRPKFISCCASALIREEVDSKLNISEDFN